MTDDDIRASINALWNAMTQLNRNQATIANELHRLSNRLMVQEAVQAVEEMEDDQQRTEH